MQHRPQITSARRADPGPTARGLGWLTGFAALAWVATGVQLYLQRDLASVVPFVGAGLVTAYAGIMFRRARREAHRITQEAQARVRGPKPPPRVVKLPTPEETASPPPIKAHPTAAPANPGRPLQRALIIDDNAVSQTVSRHLLTSLGYDVVCAANVDAAVLQLSMGTFAIVLAKQPMPGVDGPTLRGHARREAGAAPLLVGVVVAGTGDTRAQALASGFDEVLAQPLTPTALKSMLDRDAALGEEPAPPADGLEAQMTLDPSVLAEFGYSVDDKEELDEFFELFVSESSSKMEALADAAAREDWGSVTRVAHALKGSSGVTGAVRLSHAAARLEVAGKAANPVAIRTALATVQVEYERVVSRFSAQAA